MMYLQCPECLAVWQVRPEQIGGVLEVRCGDCDSIFDPHQTLRANLPERPQAPVQESRVYSGIGAGGDREVFYITPPNAWSGDSNGEDDADTQTTAAYSANPVKDHQPTAAEAPTFSASSGAGFTRSQSKPAQGARESADLQRIMTDYQYDEPEDSRGGLVFWVLGSVILAALLVGQWVVLQRDTLAANPALRPTVESVCQVVGCELPLRRFPDQFRLASRDIRPHPTVDNALIISATMVNNAAVTQAFPVMVLELSDLNENVVSMRRFLPSEYLSQSRDIQQGVAPGAFVAFSLEVVDPGDDAVAFEFSFQ